MKSRYLILFSVFVLFWILLISRGAYLQLYSQPQLDHLHQKQFNKMVSVKSRRGGIFDRNGQGLAISINTKSLFVDPSLVKNKRNLAKKLSRSLKVSYNSLRKKLNQSNRFAWVKRHLTDAEYKKIRALNIRSLGFVDEPKRIYPKKGMLSQVIGFVGRDENGQEGVEFSFNEKLSGRAKKVKMLRDAKGRPLLIEAKQVLKKSEGEDISLTIDSELQYYLEMELQKAVDKFQAQSAVGVILDVETSEVLSLANVPTFNLNRSRDYSYKYKKNRGITDSFEPGSTIKPFVIAGALDQKLIKTNSLIDCEGKPFKVGKRWIREADAKHYFKKLTPSEILVHSSNIGTTKVAFKLGGKNLLSTLKSFGFFSKSGIHLSGESKGLVNSLPWRPHLLSNISFGQGMTATPLQMAAAYAALANGGIYKTPTIIKGHKSPSRQVISKESAYILRLMLTQVTSQGGTGYMARVPGYPVAGKTGTAQKVDHKKGGYKSGAYISSFAGFIPAHNPKFAIYIAVDEPQKYYYGSQVAAPLFSKVAGFAVRKSGVTPILLSQNVIRKKLDPFSQYEVMQEKLQKSAINKILNERDNSIVIKEKMPNLEGYSLRDVLGILKKSQVKYKLKGSGYVYKTIPNSGQALSKNKKVIIYLKEGVQ